MNSAPTQGLEPYKKEDLRFQRTCQMSHKSNARVYKLKHCGNQTLWVESALVAQCAASTSAGDCYSECDSVNQDDHVCLIKTSETALTEEQSKGCIEALQYLSVQKDTIEIDDKDTCNKFCKKSKSKFGALKGQLCFCGDEAPQTTSWLNLKNTCPMELFEVTGDSASQLGRATLGLGIGAGVLALLLAALALVVFIKQRKKRNDKQRREKENSDFNPVYGTYEVHDDPVAEATDQNFDYGVVYEGEEMSKTTDVNPDYDIYDSLNT